MKKEIKVVAIVLAALIIFLSGFGIGATKGITVNVKYEGDAAVGATQAPATQAPATQAPATQAPTTAAPAGDATTAAPAGDSTTKAPEAAAPSGSSKVPSTPAEVVAAYNKAVNDTKNYKGKVHFKKDSTVNLQVTDCPGGNTVKNIIQPIVDDLAGSSTKEGDYDNGVNADGGNFYNVLTPGDRDAALTEEACASATAVAAGDGYKMTVVIKAETSVYDGTNTTYPVYHQTVTDPLNLATLDIPLTITAADMSYAGATINVTVDGEGRITEFDLKMPIEGSGSGKAGFISATVGIAGSLDDIYTFTY